MTWLGDAIRVREDALNALLKWDAARQKANGLRAQRDALRCEYWSPADHSVGDPGTARCWEAGSDDPCEPCAARQVIHEKVLAASREQSQLRQKLQRAAARLAALTGKADAA